MPIRTVRSDRDVSPFGLGLATAVGAVIGALAGALGALREAAEGYANQLLAHPVAAVGVPAIAGAATGAILYALGGLRSQGAVREYLVWILACTGGVAVALLPSMLDGPTMTDLAAIVFFGFAGGIGLAATARFLREDRDRNGY